ncbi:hypothetical protein HPB50_009525 [Hyalomma asiaticum]|uniref:Uncharacterized protein n=1 Tax=Hyalomma asiaticum TaxID=266040 RepID=A0ACB7TJV1_HYAAI|nr:hypothetical protein HPB50_009525 [Hyalomma asiaticum]
MKDPARAGTRALLGIDLRKAFDDATHEAIAQRLAATYPGKHTYNCVWSFLRGRTVGLSLTDSNAKKKLTQTNKGTPRGAVLSPFLFNLIEEALQEAVDTVAEYGGEKSELLLMRPPDYRKIKRPPPPTITIKIDGSEIRVVKHLRVLGLHVQMGRNKYVALVRLTATVTQTARLLARMSARKRGMRREGTSAAAGRLRNQKDHVRFAILATTEGRERKKSTDSYEKSTRSPWAPLEISTTHLLNVGAHNTLDELVEAYRTTQHER